MAKCSECGFLAIRDTETRELHEVEQIIRDTGYRKRVVTYRLFSEYPLCFVRAYDLNSEMGKNPNTRNILATIQRERLCDKFVGWEQGFTPKEHQEMVDRKTMLEWQAKREDTDREWRESQEKRRSKEEWNRYYFFAAITIVAVIIGVILGHLVK